MTVADDLEQATRRAATMIHPAPYNAEAPPEALTGDITPDRAALRPQQLRRARRTTARSHVGGAVENPTHAHARRPARHAGGRARRHARVRRQRPARDAAAADRRAVGRLRRLDRPLDAARCLHDVLAQARPAADGVEVRFEGADHGAYHLSPILPRPSRTT